MLDIGVVMETQPLQDLEPLGGLLGEISLSVCDTSVKHVNEESRMSHAAFKTWSA